jgi:hypothetical protein
MMEKNEQVSGSQTESEEDLLDFDLDDLTSEDLVGGGDEGEAEIIELIDLVEKGDASPKESVETSAESAELDDLDAFAQDVKAEEAKPAPEVDLDVSDITLEADAADQEEPDTDEGPVGEMSADDALEGLAVEGVDDIESVSAEEPLEEKGSGTMEFVADSDLEKLFEEELRAESADETESVETKEAGPEAAAQAIGGDDLAAMMDEKPPEVEELPPEDAVKAEESFQEIVEEVELGEQPEEVAPEPPPVMPEEPAAEEDPLTMEEAPAVVEEIPSEPAPEVLTGLTEEKVEEILTRVVGDVVERVTRETVASVAERVTRETVTTVAERVIGEAIEALKKSMER